VLLRGRDTEIISVATDDFVAAVKQVSKPRRIPFRRRMDTRKVKVIAVCQGTHEVFFEKELWSGKVKLQNNQAQAQPPTATPERNQKER
jgi:hypothetical protein